jgi:hypothetical protein
MRKRNNTVKFAPRIISVNTTSAKVVINNVVESKYASIASDVTTAKNAKGLDGVKNMIVEKVTVNYVKVVRFASTINTNHNAKNAIFLVLVEVPDANIIKYELDVISVVVEAIVSIISEDRFVENV